MRSFVDCFRVVSLWGSVCVMGLTAVGLTGDEPRVLPGGFTIPVPGADEPGDDPGDAADSDPADAPGATVPVPGTDGPGEGGYHDDLGIRLPAGMLPFTVPTKNPLTKAKIELGRQLYFDPRLSSDKSISCASCHDPAKGYSNGEAVATGVDGQTGGRSAPTIINSAYATSQFWDGRAASLEDQALGPIANPIEMNLPLDELEKRLAAIPGYKKQFEALFEEGVTALNAARALASFERTIVSGDSPFDRFERGDKSALSETARRGKELFFGKANCSACHVGAHFSDFAFHNVGIGMDDETPDVGRAKLSGLGGDTGAFRTPTLREIARTAPYMHDGRLKTLRDVVEYYNRGGTPNDYLDEEIFPLKLTDAEIDAVVAFLKEGLSSEDYPLVKPPELPE